MDAHCEKKFDNSNGKNPTTQSIFALSFKVAHCKKQSFVQKTHD